jgi:hypothetical protein
MNLTNFAEQFASKVLQKTYQNAVYRGITNGDYQGEFKKNGDRVNILSFLNSGELQDYSVGTDMSVQQMVDAEDQLIVEKRKAYNISLDRLEDLFTYATDIPEYLLKEQSMVLERTTDAYVLNKAAEETKAGNWIGIDFFIAGAASGTSASITTTATGGNFTVGSTGVATVETSVGASENPRDGVVYFAGFQNADLYKGVRLVSTAAFVSPWYRISSITSSTVAAITEWDEATSGPDFEENYTLRGLFGGDGVNFPKYGSTGDAALTTMMGLGWEFQAAIPTSVTAATIYDQVTLLAEALDKDEVPAEGRHLTVTPQLITQLRQSSEMQPTGISEIYTGTVLNGRVMRVGAFDVHSAAGSRVSTRAGHSPGSGVANDVVLSAATTGYQLLANQMGFMTYADKWTESRVVDAENQFAKKYQGLYLFGAKVPRGRRKYGAVLFASF